jgi:hypothetical protein
MIKKIVFNFIKVGVLACSLASCWESTRSIQINEVIGTYLFIYPSGEAEVLVIKGDSAYRKDIYNNFDAFKSKGERKYTNDGKWSIVGHNELKFDDWLMYNKLRFPDTILPEPVIVTMTDVYWEKSNNKKNATIWVYDESGYVFEKIN